MVSDVLSSLTAVVSGAIGDIIGSKRQEQMDSTNNTHIGPKYNFFAFISPRLHSVPNPDHTQIQVRLLWQAWAR